MFPLGIVTKVIMEGNFFMDECPRWRAYGWRWGQITYETRRYREGGTATMLYTPKKVLAYL